MRQIKAILREELGHSKRMLQKYEKALKKLPKGSLVVKNINGKDYCYLAYRGGNKVHFKYLGKIPDEDIQEYQEAKEKKKQYRGFIKDLKEQVAFLQRALNEKAAPAN
ncbi:MAG: hypothetical protein KDD48_01155 [Bdellovibrionales bacterium]|nr:hypothetical protein [Bdellovibrionales bacterium]